MPKPRSRRAHNRLPLPPSLSPLPILRQILYLQVTFYLSASILTLFTSLTSGFPFSISLILGSSKFVRSDTVQGWLAGLVWLLSSGVVVLAQILILARSKLVLDFSITLHFIHLLITWIYNREFPWEGTWWALQFVSCIGMVVGGRWGCGWRELRPISIAVPEGAGGAAGTMGDLEAGVGAGGGGGASREERGEEFEMVPMIKSGRRGSRIGEGGEEDEEGGKVV